MRWRVLSLLSAALALLAAPAVAVAAFSGPVSATVSPISVGPHTAVTVSFRQPTAGVLPGARIVEALRVTGPNGDGCIAAGGVTLASRPPGTTMRRTLDPSRIHGGRWCDGVYHGAVTVSVFPRCTPGPVRACPMFVAAPRVIATFRFRVSAH